MSTVFVSSLSSTIALPVLEAGGEVSFKRVRNSILGQLGQRLGIAVPGFIRELKLDRDAESWQERQFQIKAQLQDLTAADLPTVPDIQPGAIYTAIGVTGCAKNRILYVEDSIAELAMNLFTTPEELVAYKLLANGFAHGLWELRGVNLRVTDDELNGVRYDGSGRISPDLLQSMSAGQLVQFRAVNADGLADLEQHGILRNIFLA